MGTILEVKNLKKYFPTPRGMLHAVDDVSFQLEEGKTLGVVGESGCGKSTLGRVILHLLERTDGTILYNGEDISKPSKQELKQLRRKMQIIFQDPYSSINPRMRVADIIGEPMRIYKTCASREEYDSRVAELMDTVGLAKRVADVYPHELGDLTQFIVCDEPVSALDVSIQAQILNLMQDLQEERGLTYIFITHNLSVVKHISDDICVMYLGKLVEKCSSRELFQNNLHPYTKALLSAIPRPKIGGTPDRIILKGELTSPIKPKAGCRFAPRCLYAKPECFQTTPELAEVRENHFVACHLVKEVNGL